MIGLNDLESLMHVLSEGSIISLEQGERHRLMGLDGLAVIAQI